MQNDAPHLHPGSREGPLPPAAAGPRGKWTLSQDAYLLSPDQVLSELVTDLDTGLSESAAKERLSDVGLNELQGGGGVSVVRILMGQIFNAMVLVSASEVHIRASRTLR